MDNLLLQVDTMDFAEFYKRGLAYQKEATVVVPG